MTTQPYSLKTILREIITAAMLGGRELTKRHQTRDQLRVRVKTVPSDFFTAADKASEKKIVEHLQRRLPGMIINSEETPNVAETNGKLVAEIDPLDGSMAYKHGQHYYAVSIGIRRNNTLIAGAIYLPALNELFYAATGKGSYRVNTNGKKDRPIPLKV
ncbi:MAG: inositol monophosphatase family protein, partial [Candidatus Micrarchaeota archaeon]|nr:inositol monophosphatase family protein [Candidatus Micrarchaeota archaeon]